MARKKKSTKEVENVRLYVEGVAKSLVDRLYGTKGPAWGTTMTELEDVVVAVRDLLSDKMLQALQRQADTQTAERPEKYGVCPGCHGPVQPVLKDGQPSPEARVMTCRPGDAEWSEPHDYCRRCRQSFFPSEPESGD